MNLFPSHKVNSFYCNGFLVEKALFTKDEVNTIVNEAKIVASQQSQGVVFEDDDCTIRSINGAHKSHPFFSMIIRDKRLIDIVRHIVNESIYVHQFKINFKKAFSGDVWEWHQDFLFWNKEDGMPEPKAITAAIFLDAVTEFNSPLVLIPGSHHEQTYSFSIRKSSITTNISEDWRATTSSKLKYKYDQSIITRLVQKHGMIAPKGEEGSVLFFHSNIFHASTSNISPNDRKLLLISYNPISNKLKPVPYPRPDFLACRTFEIVG